MHSKKDVRFFSVFFAATLGILVDLITTFVDEVVAGDLFDDAAFASVNLIEPCTYFTAFAAYLISVGGCALIIRAEGAGDRKKMSELYSQSVILCVLCGIVLTLIYVLFTPQLVRLVADDPALYAQSLDYFKAMRFFPLVTIMDSFLFTYVLYRGGYVQFYAASMFRIITNVLLSYLLGLRMGLMGIGIASVASSLISLLFESTFLLTKKHGLKLRWYLNAREALVIAGLGLPESCVFVFGVIMEMAVNTFTLKHYGAAGVAAVSVVINVFEGMIYLSEGISEYESVALNRSIGRRDSRSMDRGISVTLRAAVIEGSVFTGLILLAANVLPAAFDIDDAGTARLAAVMLRILAPGAVFVCLVRVTAIFYQYTRRIKRTLILFGLFIAVLPSGLGMLFGQLAPEGIAAGISAGPAAALSLMYGYVRLIRKEKLFDYSLMDLK